MKWKEVKNLQRGTPLTRFGGRRAVLVEIIPENETISVSYVDEKRGLERCKPTDFDLGWKETKTGAWGSF